MAPEKKQFILNAFVMQAPGHLNPGLFKYPNDKGRSYNDVKHWMSLAQKLEKAKFHAMFFADVLGGYDVYNGPANLDATIPAASQFPINDPLYSVPAMAAVTESIGFGVTASTTYESPYAMARKFSTVDHLSNGRVAWNIVTSYLDSAARNFGLDTQIEHDKRYEIAHEYLDVTYKLWEGSWRDDAVTNAPKDSYADSRGVRQINHKGEHFNVPGPHICEPSRQRTPFLFQAGTSSAGRKFAATHAEAIFLNGHTAELVRPSVDSIRAQAKEFGRDPQSIKIVAGLLVVVGETDEKAKEKYELLASYGDREGALALFGGWSGYDLGRYGDDEDFRFLDTAPPAVRSMVNHWASSSPQGTKWNKKTIAEHLIIGGNGAKIIGSAKTCADELERWMEVADVDGFNLSYASIPETFDDIIEFLIPELRRRGLFHEDYAVPGGTLRENYLGAKGRSRLDETHPGAKYFWKAGEDVPAYARVEAKVNGSDGANGHDTNGKSKKRRLE
ncbi:Nitrilotriacetate monooxygenase component A/pristinamycin IIA synthase subunit A [Mollisia scopiformis]|uniref:Nitrilotriacetate monooxygenase component A/pristinamycin IIA synthase subunit A n=1 Tax=Mollisia scopiformis TaxID=149040 RepID=A0A194WXA6_MOLSC|nr:Nitrilotriacetate monooxygenase component A/pristinamycin IIA synthase subunit A [Mollisia scopiformis]KUJ12616.1 Nitrilotriacetate monooxygenase component A/pristinamycin IIA synthase subunit A [Mollisia scopiformis]